MKGYLSVREISYKWNVSERWVSKLAQAVNPANTISAGSVTRTIVSLFFLSAIPPSARDLSADNHLFACENQPLILTVKVCFFALKRIDNSIKIKNDGNANANRGSERCDMPRRKKGPADQHEDGQGHIWPP